MTYTPTTKLLRQATVGILGVLDDAGIGYQPGAGANKSLPLLSVKARPAAPNEIIAVTVYSVRTDLQSRISVLRVQLWTRGAPNDPLGADDIADLAFNLLHGVRHGVWNGLEIGQVAHKSTAVMGADEHGRYSRTDNYEIVTQRRDQ